MKKTKLTIEEVKHVAKLANLPLTDGELTKIQPQLDAILDLVNKIQELPTESTPVTAQVTGLESVMREDEIDVTRMLTQEQALFGAKRKYNGFFVAPNVFD